MAIGMTKIDGLEIASEMAVAAATTVWSVTADTPMNAATTEMYLEGILKISVDFVTGASEDAIVHLRYSTDETADVVTYAKTISPPASLPGTVVVHHRVPSFDYLDVGIENTESATYGVTVDIEYTGMKMTGMAEVA